MRKRSLRRFLLEIEQHPQSKNIEAEDAIVFQKAVADRLGKCRASAFRGKVFLQLEFTTASKTPPAIYKLPKNYLDLLEVPRKDSGIARQRLLYKNDRQVKALVVRYRLNGLDGRPGIWVKAEPWRDFVADIDLVERIRRDGFEDDDRRRGFGTEDFGLGPFEDDGDADDDKLEKLVAFMREKASFVRDFGGDAYEAQREMMRRIVQQTELRRTDRFICRGVLSAFQNAPRGEGGAQDGYLAQLAAVSRNMSLGSPFVLDLHHAPHRKGDSEAFDHALRKALSEFKAKRPDLFPLSSQMCVTILMVPPVGGGKDLDNLARLILPALHEIWAPPSHAAHMIKAENIKDGGIRTYWEKLQKSLLKEPKHSITKYRVFELPRLPGDSKNGFVRLAVGEGQMPVPFREGINRFLHQWRDTVDW